jgi:cytochrome c oxidase accessory protein FixG
MPVEAVVAAITSPPGEHLTAFLFVAVVTLLVFGNFTWFREQTCIVVCPYGRLQGALYDPDTVLVGYDQQRGEPRGPAGTAGAGDCVDCFRCVAVCPTGIDIRNGTQMECVGCANCIDACDEVMARLGRARGLVRYDSQRGFATGRRRFVRARVVLYGVLLLVGATVFALAAGGRTSFEANLIRPPGAAFTVAGDRLTNVLQLHLVNKMATEATFRIEPLGPEGAEVTIAQREIRLASLADARIPVVVVLGVAGFARGARVTLRVATVGPAGPVEATASAPLVGPYRR